MDEEAPGWIAVLGSDPDDDDAPKEVFAFCPPCAAREFRMARTIGDVRLTIRAGADVIGV